MSGHSSDFILALMHKSTMPYLPMIWLFKRRLCSKYQSLLASGAARTPSRTSAPLHVGAPAGPAVVKTDAPYPHTHPIGGLLPLLGGKPREESTSSTLACRVVRERYPSGCCLLSCTASFVEMLRDAGSNISTFARLTHSLPATRYSLLATRYSLLATRTSQHPLAPLQVACSLFWAASRGWLAPSFGRQVTFG